MSISAPSLPLVTSYVQIPFTTDPNDLADLAVANLQSVWTGWQPNDADLSVVLIEALAPMAANAAQIAANMPAAALIAFGQNQLGIPYQQAVSASAIGTFTVQDANGPYDIPAGSEVDLAGVAFQTTADLTVPNGSTSGSVVLAATVAGAYANNLSASGWVPVNLPTYVTGLTLSANTSGGIDAQDDSDYLNSIAQELQLRALSIITLLDFEIVAVNTAGIGRCVAVGQGVNPRNILTYVTDTSGNPVSSAIKTTLAASYAKARMVNAVVTVNDPAYTTVSVTYTVESLPSVDPTGLQSAINAALDTALSPATWGIPTSIPTSLSWVDQPVVHVNKLIGIISGVSGVDYVTSLSMSGSNIAQLPDATSNAATGTSAITTLAVNAMPNPAASGAVCTITDSTGAHTDTFTLSASAAAGATSLTFTSHAFNFNYPSGSTISFPLSTAGALTSIGVNALVNAIANGTTVTITDPTGAHTQTWTLSSAAAVSATTLSVTSQTPSYAFPSTSAISGAVTGDLTMNQNASGALPKAGTMSGTINVPTT